MGIGKRAAAVASKYFRYPRHLKALLQHAGVRKTANVLLVESERLRRASRLRGKPYYYFVDPCNVCNLRCPLCPTGNGDLERTRGMLKLSDYQAILEKIAPYAVEVSLHNWGEPLLNKDVLRMTRCTADLGIATNMSSNLSIERPGLGRDLVDSGLEYLIVSLDGTTQDVYEQYRVRGDVELVYHNMREVIEAKKRLRSRTPVVEWQFIVFKHNEHQMDDARRLARELGVDRLRFRSPGLQYSKVANLELGDQWLPANPAYWELHPGVLRKQGYLWDEPCFYLWRSMTINPGGGIAACCIVYNEKQDFGNLLHGDLNTIWNSEKYRRSRALYATAPIARAGTICDTCYLFNRHVKGGLPRGAHDSQRPSRGYARKPLTVP
jgi:MoaA/NifB/PqqE/SkfB family radical SAM enzyme